MKNLLLSGQTLFQKHKVLLVSILIFFLVFLSLGVPYFNWWFNGDDYLGLLQGYQTKTWGDLFYYFINGNIHQGMGPTNMVPTTTPPTFFSVYYRPLYLVYLSIQYWLFGTNAYFYLLTNVFFHAINTVILFNIFLRFIDLYPALLASLTFAFHPQIAYRFGAIVNLHYYINVMLMLLCLLIFKKYLDTKKIIYNFIACVLFALSLFTRETTIVLPAIIFFGAYLYEKYLNNRSYGSTGSPRTGSQSVQHESQINLSNQKPTTEYEKIKNGNLLQKISVRGEPVEPYEHQNLFQSLKQTFGICLVALAFLSLRAYLYPIKFVASSKKFGPISWLINKFPEFQVITYDFLGLSWLPWGHKTIRGLIVISLLSILIWLFIKNTKKIYILYFLFSMLLMFWLILFGGYCPRYFYEAQPFALMALAFLFKFYDGDFGIFKKIGLFLLTILVIFYIEFCIENFRIRERKMYQLSRATEELVKNPIIKNKNLCFLGYPADGCGGQNAPIYWILFNNTSISIYFDTSTSIMQADSNIVQTTAWRNIASNYFSENYLKIEPIKNGFRFISLNPNKVFFNLDDGGYYMGKKFANKKERINGKGVVTDFTLLIDQKYLDQKPLFITWNYKTKKFVFLEIKN